MKIDVSYVELVDNPTNVISAKEMPSDFESYFLKKLGDWIRSTQPNSQFFWRNGAYCWYTDETQSRIQSVFLLGNGVCILRDSIKVDSDEKSKYFRLSF